MNILRINPADTYEVRSKVLRPGLPLSSCKFDSDDEDQTFHLGAFLEGKLVSVASFYFENHKDIASHEYQYRLRGMATLSEHQGKGMSKALLRMAFPIIKQNLCTILWCNARTSAEGFYKNVGFTTLSEVFDIEGVGPHVLMSKEIVKQFPKTKND